MSEAGRELDDVWTQLAAEKKLADEMDIDLPSGDESGASGNEDDDADNLPAAVQ